MYTIRDFMTGIEIGGLHIFPICVPDYHIYIYIYIHTYAHLVRSVIKETSKSALLVVCEGNSPVTGEFPAQRASNAEKASMWWRHHELADSVMYTSRNSVFDVNEFNWVTDSGSVQNRQLAPGWPTVRVPVWLRGRTGCNTCSFYQIQRD